jgi:hypothetical protein
MCRRSEPSVATSRNVFWILLFQLVLAASVAWGRTRPRVPHFTLSVSERYDVQTFSKTGNGK